MRVCAEPCTLFKTLVDVLTLLVRPSLRLGSLLAAIYARAHHEAAYRVPPYSWQVFQR